MATLLDFKWGATQKTQLISPSLGNPESIISDTGGDSVTDSLESTSDVVIEIKSETKSTDGDSSSSEN